MAGDGSFAPVCKSCMLDRTKRDGLCQMEYKDSTTLAKRPSLNLYYKGGMNEANEGGVTVGGGERVVGEVRRVWTPSTSGNGERLTVVWSKMMLWPLTGWEILLGNASSRLPLFAERKLRTLLSLFGIKISKQSYLSRNTPSSDGLEASKSSGTDKSVSSFLFNTIYMYHVSFWILSSCFLSLFWVQLRTSL